MLLHINPTRSEGSAPDPSLAISGWYMTFFAAGVIDKRAGIQIRRRPPARTPKRLYQRSRSETTIEMRRIHHCPRIRRTNAAQEAS